MPGLVVVLALVVGTQSDGVSGVVTQGPGLTTWCPYAKLAWEFAGHIQPWRAPHLMVFDALQLALCNATRPPTTATTVPLHTPPVPHRTTAAAAVVVDVQRGNDQTGMGTEASPFKTIGRGVAAAINRTRSGGMAVVVHQGVYHLGASVLHLGQYITHYNIPSLFRSGAEIWIRDVFCYSYRIPAPISAGALHF